MKNILVIKLGALGDFMYALGAMKAIRAHHRDARITLLTQRPYADLARLSNYFDDMLLDPKPRYNPLDWLSLRSVLNEKKFDRVYDLQNNDRSANYFKLFSPRPEWSGIVKGASHRNTDPDRRSVHAFIGLKQNLTLAGIAGVALDPLDWLSSDISAFNLKKPYILLVPGSSANRPNKRWSAEKFRDLAQRFIAEGIQPVLLGAENERGLAETIGHDLEVLDLAGKTDFDALASLARGASLAVGNDTGPMHLISMTECPVIMFFRSDESTVKKHGPQNAANKCFEAASLEEITVGDVFLASGEIMRKD